MQINTSFSFEWDHSRVHRKQTAVRHKEKNYLKAICWDPVESKGVPQKCNRTEIELVIRIPTGNSY